MSEKLSDSFENLTIAATAKNKTIDSLARYISELTRANAELTTTVKKLTAHIETALNQNRSRNNNNNNSKDRYS